MKSFYSFYVLTVAFLLPLLACGDDSSSSAKKSTNSEANVEYDSVDDLPKCTSDNAGDLAKIKDTIYSCYDKKWEKTDGFAAGVCNIPACDKSTEGSFQYVESAKGAFLCKSGSWVDAAGKPFSDSAFIDCFIDGLITETVTSADSLKKCTEKREGALAYVKKNIYACTSKKWQKQKEIVVAPADIDNCKSGEFAYVLSQMKSINCKDLAKSSSSQKAETASSSSTSKDAISSSSKAEPVDDGTKVRGICTITEKNVTKGNPVSYVFYNMGGTPLTYTWEFGENSNPAVSDEASPQVVYSRGGIYKAKLIVNKGLKSQSDTITCSMLEIAGTPVTGCKCSTPVTQFRASDRKPASITWTVTDCAGEPPFEYEWTGSSSLSWLEIPESKGTSYKGIATQTATAAPTVIVSNADGETMSPQCTPVTIDGAITATCSLTPVEVEIEVPKEEETEECDSEKEDCPEEKCDPEEEECPKVPDSVEIQIEKYYELTASDFKNVKKGVTTLAMTLSSDDGMSMEAVADNPDGMYSSYYWDYFSTTFKFLQPETPGIYSYTLIYDKDTLCTVSPVTCRVGIIDNIYRNTSIFWLMEGAGDYEVKSYLWTFIDADGNKTTSKEEFPNVSFDVVGQVKATLTVGIGDDIQKTMECTSINILPRPITGCTCTQELASASDDLADGDVTFRWKISGCKSEKAEPLTYTWDADYEVDAADEKVSSKTFKKMGAYSPTVHVKNQDGSKINVSCPRGVVLKDGKGAFTEIESMHEWSAAHDRVIEAGNYYFKTCGPYSSGHSLDLYGTENQDEAITWIKKGLVNTPCTGCPLEVEFPLEIMIPSGKTMRANCW